MSHAAFSHPEAEERLTLIVEARENSKFTFTVENLTKEQIRDLFDSIRAAIDQGEEE